MWQVFIVFCCFTTYHMIRQPFLYFYRMNNKHRTYATAKAKEVAYKKKMRELEEAEEAAE